VKCLGDREDRRTLPFRAGRSFVIAIVARWMLVAVLADVEVQMEESCSKLAVAVPVTGGVQTETSNADDDCQAQNRAGQS